MDEDEEMFIVDSEDEMEENLKETEPQTDTNILCNSTGEDFQRSLLSEQAEQADDEEDEEEEKLKSFMMFLEKRKSSCPSPLSLITKAEMKTFTPAAPKTASNEPLQKLQNTAPIVLNLPYPNISSFVFSFKAFNTHSISKYRI